jgi:5-methylcytosine-specific restriction endonuclease McrA
MKNCKTCKKPKAEDAYYANRLTCKECVIARVKSNTDPITKAEYDKKRRELKKEELRAYDRERAKLPHRRAAHNEDTRKRRAKLKDAIPDDYDREGVLAMYKLAQKISTITGVEMHVDHIVPLACGGEHNVGNLQLLAGPINLAKGANPHFQLPWSRYPA